MRKTRRPEGNTAERLNLICHREFGEMKKQIVADSKKKERGGGSKERL